MDLPSRQPLPHDVPDWVAPSAEIFFITICGSPRGEDQFCNEEAWEALVDSIGNRIDREVWWMDLFLAMPDHVHFLVSFSESAPLQKTMGDWKHWLSHRAGLKWQRDFFDHRMRSEESIEEKRSYIRANPERAGLVKSAKDWRWVYAPSAEHRW